MRIDSDIFVAGTISIIAPIALHKLSYTIIFFHRPNPVMTEPRETHSMCCGYTIKNYGGPP